MVSTLSAVEPAMPPEAELELVRRRFGYLKNLYLEADKEREDLKKLLYGENYQDNKEKTLVCARYRFNPANFVETSYEDLKQGRGPEPGRKIVFDAIYEGRSETFPDTLIASGFAPTGFRVFHFSPPPPGMSSRDKLGSAYIGRLGFKAAEIRTALRQAREKLIANGQNAAAFNVVLYPLPPETAPKLTLYMEKATAVSLLEAIRAASGLELFYDTDAILLGPPGAVQRFQWNRGRASPPPSAEIERAMAATKIPKTGLQNAPAAQYARLLAAMAGKSGVPAAKRLGFIAALPVEHHADTAAKTNPIAEVVDAADLGLDIKLGETLTDEDLDVALSIDNAPNAPRRADLSLNNVSLKDWLAYICFMFDLEYATSGENVILRPPAETPLARRTFHLTRREAATWGMPRDPKALQTFFIARGVSFPPGANVSFHPEEASLTMENTKSGLANLQLALNAARNCFPAAIGGIDGFADTQAKETRPGQPVKVYAESRLLGPPSAERAAPVRPDYLFIEAISPLKNGNKAW